MMQEMNVDDIHNLMDDMKDIQEDQEEISDAMARNYDVDVCDSELDAGINRFNLLELDELDYQMKYEFNPQDLTVPNKRVLSQKETDERELEDMLK
jgi:hypothetical protein